MSPPLAYLRVAELAAALGVSRINALPGCWELDVGDGYQIAVNGHSRVVQAANGDEVPPYSLIVYLRGWPVMLLDPAGGVQAHSAEEPFIAAVERRIAQAAMGEM